MVVGPTSPPGVEFEVGAVASEFFPTDGPRRKSRGLLLLFSLLKNDEDIGLGRLIELGLRLDMLVMDW